MLMRFVGSRPMETSCSASGKLWSLKAPAMATSLGFIVTEILSHL
jgi:hypothetical protein